ncbi:MAG: DUF5647 family protein [bacterium]
MNSYSKVNSMFAFEFQKYLIEHPEIADQIPSNALIIFQIRGDENYNRWSYRTSMKNREKEQPVIRVTLNKWRETSSLEDLVLSRAA